MDRRINVRSLKDILKLNDKLDRETLSIVQTVLNVYEVHVHNANRSIVYVYAPCYSMDDALIIRRLIDNGQTNAEFSELLDKFSINHTQEETENYKVNRECLLDIYTGIDNLNARLRECMKEDSMLTSLRFTIYDLIQRRRLLKGDESDSKN